MKIKLGLLIIIEGLIKVSTIIIRFSLKKEIEHYDENKFLRLNVT